jgi:aspartyl aminopeptidase
MENYTNDFLDFLKNATNPYHAVIECESILQENNFIKLSMEDEWNLEHGGKYYIIPYPSSIIAFTLGTNRLITDGFRIIASHTDSPCLKIKPMPEMVVENYMKVNTEVYGGPILNTWMDRLLSFGGRVVLKSDNIRKPKIRYIDYKKPVMTIPNLAIHMNSDINKGIELNKQKDLLPIMGQIDKDTNKEKYLLNLIGKEIGESPENILDYDLYVYLAEEGVVTGVDGEFVSAPRLDDLSMVYASIKGIINGEHKDGINIAACFDNEEIGSRTKQGADSNLFAIITERIAIALGKSKTQYYRMLSDSYMISADGAHGLHPNYPEKNDPTNKPTVNKGIAIKINASKKYSSDAVSIGVFQQLCEKEGVEVQKFVNRSDLTGGSTLGTIATKYLPISAVDIGVPMLAMHSSREIMGTNDFLDTIKLFTGFYNL